MRHLADLTLDELVDCLIGSEEIQISGGPAFSIVAEDSRRALAFYNKDRQLFWNPNKDTNISETEIDRLLDALDKPLVTRSITERPPAGKQKWRLSRVVAHRFRGLHRHCADNGRDPVCFELELSVDAILLRGFNGAGKTSLISAICWCLTGYGYRAQALPAPLHEAVEVRLSSQAGADEADDHKFELPPIVPIPNEDELAWVDGTPKHDTWVKLTFTSLYDGREVVVERYLEREGRKGFKTRSVGLETLGLPDLALQVGSLMPGIAASARFDDKTTLSQAVSTLTGLRPLAHFGKRSERVHDRLTKKYPDEAKEAKANAHRVAEEQIQTLGDLLKAAEGLPVLDCVLPPGDDAPDSWKNGLIEAERQLQNVEETAAADAEQILGRLPSLETEVSLNRFGDALGSVRTHFANSALKGLPSMQIAQQLGAITDEDAKATETILREIEEEAESLVQRLADAERASRLRLYGLVARWHEAEHPGKPFTNCPVCSTNLTGGGPVPRDGLLDKSVAEALEASRAAQGAALMTAKEWEETTASRLRGRLPETIRPFLDTEVPDTIAALQKSALSVEVFKQSEFPAAFQSLAANIAGACDKAWLDAPKTQPLLSFSLPAGIPDNAGLRAAMTNVLKAIRLSRYRNQYADIARAAMREVLEADPQPPTLPVSERSISAQFALIERYLESARHFAGIRRQLTQIKETCERWKKTHERIGKLARAADAVKVFTTFPKLVHDQVEGLITNLKSRTASWADGMYRAAVVNAPAFAGFDTGKSDGFSILAAQGKHLVDAHHIMNASALRIYLVAFVLALWQQIWDRSGGIANILLDDPQDLLDPNNVENLAATIPHLLDAGICPLIVSNDFGFIPAVEDYIRAHRSTGAAKRSGVWEFSAISRSKSHATLVPVIDEVRERCTDWKADPNNPALAREFVFPIRKRIEMKLWDHLAADPTPLNDPTLNDLLGKIANARNRGERPFNEEPFRKLIDLVPLKTGAQFREIINRASHGRADRITPTDAEIVEANFEEVFSAIDACWLAYARFMGRLPLEAIAPTSNVPAPNVVTFPQHPYPIIGRLAAHEKGAPFAAIESAAESFSLASLGPVALFTLRAPTLGLVAFPGQTLITVANATIQNGDIAVVQTDRRVYARRIGVDKHDPARIVLETLPSSNPKVPPTHFQKTSDARLLKVVGVLFDDVSVPNASDEAVLAQQSPILSQVVAAARVAGDSAFPIAVNGGHVLLGAPPADIRLLEGRIIAVMTRADRHSQEYLAYLKRLGKPLPATPSVYYLENVGETGEGEYVEFARGQSANLDAVPVVERYWKVHGTLFN